MLPKAVCNRLPGLLSFIYPSPSPFVGFLHLCFTLSFHGVLTCPIKSLPSGLKSHDAVWWDSAGELWQTAAEGRVLGTVHNGVMGYSLGAGHNGVMVCRYMMLFSHIR